MTKKRVFHRNFDYLEEYTGAYIGSFCTESGYLYSLKDIEYIFKVKAVQDMKRFSISLAKEGEIGEDNFYISEQDAIKLISYSPKMHGILIDFLADMPKMVEQNNNPNSEKAVKNCELRNKQEFHKTIDDVLLYLSEKGESGATRVEITRKVYSFRKSDDKDVVLYYLMNKELIRKEEKKNQSSRPTITFFISR